MPFLLFSRVLTLQAPHSVPLDHRWDPSLHHSSSMAAPLPPLPHLPGSSGYQQLGELEKAEDDLVTAVALQPSDPLLRQALKALEPPLPAEGG